MPALLPAGFPGPPLPLLRRPPQELAARHPLAQPLQALAHLRLLLLPQLPLVPLPLRRMHQETPCLRPLPRHFLHLRAVLLRLPVPPLARHPAVLLHRRQRRVHDRVAPPLHRHQVAQALLLHRRHAALRLHAPVAHEHEAPQPEPRPQVADHPLHGRAVLAVAGAHRVRHRQPVHHGHSHQDLRVGRTLVPRVAVPGQFRGAEAPRSRCW